MHSLDLAVCDPLPPPHQQNHFDKNSIAGNPVCFCFNLDMRNQTFASGGRDACVKRICFSHRLPAVHFFRSKFPNHSKRSDGNAALMSRECLLKDDIQPVSKYILHIVYEFAEMQANFSLKHLRCHNSPCSNRASVHMVRGGQAAIVLYPQTNAASFLSTHEIYAIHRYKESTRTRRCCGSSRLKYGLLYVRQRVGFGNKFAVLAGRWDQTEQYQAICVESTIEGVQMNYIFICSAELYISVLHY